MQHPSKLLKELNLAPLKKLGQNFLVQSHSLASIPAFLDKNEPVLEIGPGLGMVTDFLLEAGFRLVLCEKDRQLAQHLRQKYAGQAQVEIHEGDFLEFSPDFWLKTGVKQVVGNLPFYITTPILVSVIKTMPFIRRAVFGIQWEVADRILQKEGNSLCIFMQAAGLSQLLSKISRNSFYPVPEVDAAWLGWQRQPRVEQIDHLEILLRGAFWGKRKSLLNSLGKNPFFAENPVSAGWQEKIQLMKTDPAWSPLLEKRADQLNFAQFEALLRKLQA